MEYIRISEIDFSKCINMRVFVEFMARDVEIKTQKDGLTKYISLSMCDKDIKVDAKKFGANENDIHDMINGGIYYAAIDVKEYKGGYSCIVYNFERSDSEYTKFLNWTSGIDEAHKIIQDTIKELNGSIYCKIVYNILNNNWDKLCTWAAASSIHHEALGGLLVHTAEVIEQSKIIARYWCSKYGEKFINKPLLLSSALLHDIAKTQELNVDIKSGNVEYSTRASLETHITMCVSMIDIESYKLKIGEQEYNNEGLGVKTEAQIESEKEAISLLKHCILSHHGKLEYSSPIVPHIPEAFILSMADRLSAEMYHYSKEFKQMDACSSHSMWVGGNMVNTYKDSSKIL